FNFGGEIRAAKDTIVDQFKGSDRSFSEDYRDNLDLFDARAQAESARHPYATGAARVAGAIATAPLTELRALQGSSLLVRGTSSGAISGALA
ncbi:UNVERIFIED_CONTAM: hypothetical protein IGO34_28965, partial [Salmonella enterica subsp. enterica serovar Weltevreden]